MVKYKRLYPNLTENEIGEIYGIFASLDPDDEGLIKSRRVLELYQQTQEYPELKKRFMNYQMVDFDQFLSVLGDGLSKKKSQFANVEFESDIKDVSCFLCPIPVSTETVGRDSVRVRSKNTD